MVVPLHLQEYHSDNHYHDHTDFPAAAQQQFLVVVFARSSQLAKTQPPFFGYHYLGEKNAFLGRLLQIQPVVAAAATAAFPTCYL